MSDTEGNKLPVGGKWCDYCGVVAIPIGVKLCPVCKVKDQSDTHSDQKIATPSALLQSIRAEMPKKKQIIVGLYGPQGYNAAVDEFTALLDRLEKQG